MGFVWEKIGSFKQAHNLAWMLIVLVGTVFTYNFYKASIVYTAQEDRLAFEAQVLPRYTVLSSSVEAVDLRLNAIASFLGVTQQPSEKSFNEYATRLGAKDSAIEYCWVSLRPLVVHSIWNNADSLCNDFSPLQTSDVFLDGNPRSLLSLPVYAGNLIKGFAVAVVPLQTLIVENAGSVGLREFLVFMDTSRNLFQSYSVSDVGIASVDALGNDNSKEGLTFPLKRIGAFDFVYVAKPVETEFTWFEYGSVSLSILIWSLFFASALYIRAIIFQNSEVQRQVEIRTEELSQFSYRASHDLKSPLSNIGGLVRFAQEDARDGNKAELSRNLQKIAEQVKRLENLVGDILDLAMSDVKAGANEWVDINRLLEVTISNNASQASNNGVVINKEFARIPEIESSNIRLVQIMDNLLNNAIKYADKTKAESTVTISSKVAGDNVVIAIADNGMGIPEEHMGDLFTVFTRFHPEYSQGSGLGLSIVQRHLEKLGGTISVDSVEHVGTTMIVSLPLSRR